MARCGFHWVYTNIHSLPPSLALLTSAPPGEWQQKNGDMMQVRCRSNGADAAWACLDLTAFVERGGTTWSEKVEGKLYIFSNSQYQSHNFIQSASSAAALMWLSLWFCRTKNYFHSLLPTSADVFCSSEPESCSEENKQIKLHFKTKIFCLLNSKPFHNQWVTAWKFLVKVTITNNTAINICMRKRVYGIGLNPNVEIYCVASGALINMHF